ncbi:Uncharacterised protein [Mycobacteroides abscessus subsp. massiliense]|nr:Uncharacterised protein [Mycobacteroides abscessus subsp. massiliense]
MRNHDIGLARGHAFDIGTPLAGDLDAALHCLGPGIHRQHHALAAEPGQVATESAEAIRVEGPAHQGHGVELCVRRREDLGVPVAEVHR